jgi:hypothetical protein
VHNSNKMKLTRKQFQAKKIKCETERKCGGLYLCVFIIKNLYPFPPSPHLIKKKKKKKKKAQESMIGPLSYSPKNPQTDADIKIQ